MSERIEVYVEDEEDFVNAYLNTPRPCIIWTRPNFDVEKMKELMSERGFVLLTNLDEIKHATCFPFLEKERE